MNNDDFERFKKNSPKAKDIKPPFPFEILHQKIALLVFDIATLQKTIPPSLLPHMRIHLTNGFASALLSINPTIDEAFIMLREIEKDMQFVDKITNK